METETESVKLHQTWRDGPVGRPRRCTDFLFLIILISSWVAMTGVGLVVTGVIDSEHLQKGNPERLINGMDYLGNICGVTNYVKSNGEDVIDLTKAYFLPSGSAVCVESCPSENNFEKFYCKYDIEDFITEQVATVTATNGEAASNKLRKSLYLYHTTTKQCMPSVASRAYLGYCQPLVLLEDISEQLDQAFQENNITSTTNVTNDMISDGDFFDKTMADAFLSRYVIFAFGLGGAMILGFLFLLMIRTPGVLATLVWTCILCIMGGLCVGGYYMKETSIRWEMEGLKESHEVKGMYWLSIISYTFAGIWFLIICCIRKRIYLAISCVKEASTAMSAMPIIITYPMFQVLGFFSFLLPWGLYMTYLASSGKVEGECICPNKSQSNINFVSQIDYLKLPTNSSVTPECDDGCFMYKSFTYSTNTKYAGLYMLFTFFWTSQFIVAVGQLVIAMSISMWYFTKEKRVVGNSTFMRAMLIASFYHLGTCAFGSLIIAIVKTIRSVITYFERKARRMRSSVAQIMIRTLQCCLWCLEKCLKFVNKNAYIQTAIHGHSFCQGAREAFHLILRNVLRISAVSIVSEFVLLVGKVFIVTISTLGAYFYLDTYFSDDLNGIYLPIILVFLTAYATAEMFNEVFGMAILTILQCFVTDEELFEPEDRYASGSLANTIEKTQQSSMTKNLVYPDDEDEKEPMIVKRRTTVKKKTSFMKRLLNRDDLN